MKDLLIIGAGACGLSSAHFAKKAGLDVAVFESSDRVGGKIQTSSIENCFDGNNPNGGGQLIAEHGPLGWLDHEPLLQELCRDLGLTPIESQAADEHRYILHNQRLVPLPLSPGAFLRSALLSLSGKIRFAIEPWANLSDNANESVWEFAARRFGVEAANTFTQAICGGLFAANPRETDMNAMFAPLVGGEHRDGQITRSMRGFARRAAQSGGTAICTFQDGLEVLPLAMAESLSGHVQLESPIDNAHFHNDAWSLYIDGEEVGRGRNLLLTCPAKTTATLLRHLEPSLIDFADAARGQDLTVTTLVYPEIDLAAPLHGFGILGSTDPTFPIQSVQFLHNSFSTHTPRHCAVLRVMTKEPQFDTRELQALLGLPAKPKFAVTHTTPMGVPHYRVGHAQRFEKLEDRLAAWRGLHLGGDSFSGIGINAAVRRGAKIITKILSADS